MDRKEMVKALERQFNVKSKYMGTPSFAYQIEVEENIFTIDKEGEITDTGGKKYGLEEVLKGKRDAITKDQLESIGFEVIADMTGHTGASLKNLINMLYSKQQFIRKAFVMEADLIEIEVINKMKENKILEIGDFIAIIKEVDVTTYRGLYFDFEKSQIIFKFNGGETGKDKMNTYIQLMTLVNNKAKEIKYASNKVTISDNPKYTFRTWLLRLGMIGDEYKVARKVLLANLEGNIAFRDRK